MIGLVLVIRVSRSVSSSLVDLAHQAEKLATETLPATVQAILDAGATGGDLPEVPESQSRATSKRWPAWPMLSRR